MARISIESAKAKGTLTRQSELENTLKGLYQEIEDVRSGLTYKIAGQEAISARLRTAAKQINKEAGSTRAMRSGLEEVIACYEQTENGNRERVVVAKTPVQGEGQSSGGHRSHAPSNWIKGLIDLLDDRLGPGGRYPPIFSTLPYAFALLPSGQFLHADGDTEFESKVEVDAKKAFKDTDPFKKVSDFEDANKTTEGKKYYYDPKTQKTTLVDENDKVALDEFKKHNKGAIPLDVKVAGVGTSGSLSLWNSSGETGPNGIGGASYSVDVGKVEGNIGAYAGVLGIGASIGASVTGFTAEEKAYLGNEDLQVYEKVGVTAGKIGADADFSAGFVDKDGKFNPSFYAGASAEAIAGEVSGSVGVKALGADVAVKGSLNYGIGAHANVGIHDGKISVDVGATFGVGASVKLDIDVSGTVEAIGDIVGNVASGLKDFLGW